MLRDPASKWLHDNRRSILGWAVAIVAVGSMYAAFWPTINNPDVLNAMASYPAAMMEALNFDDITTAAGYLSGSVYGLLAALLIAIYAISAGTRSIAGDEEAGTLDLVLAHPMTRTQLAFRRFAALLVSLLVIDGALLAALLALRGPADLGDVALGRFAAMHLHLFAFAAVHGAFGFAIGASTGRRSVTLAISSSLAVLGYLANGVFPQVEQLQWTAELSPFHWYIGGDPLVNGVDLSGILLLTVTTIVAVLFGVWRFNQRDLAV